jgi:hypothetical protein
VRSYSGPYCSRSASLRLRCHTSQPTAASTTTATTEDLRQAMVFYRALFQDLLEDREHAGAADARASASQPEREVERAAVRADERIHEADEHMHDDDATQIPIQRVTGRPNGTEREVRS